jgi:hypothetical protein
MKKSGIVATVAIVSLIVVMAASSASTLDWNDYFDTPIFDGSVFNESDVIDVPEEQELPKRLTNFPPGWFNETPKEEYTNKPPSWFNVSWFSEIPIGEYSDKPPGWFDVI